MTFRQARICASLLATCVGLLQSPYFAHAQAGKPALVSPVIHDDGKATVSLKAPKASAVKVSSGELQRVVGAEALVMKKSDDGVWTATFGPVPPGIYDFAFDVDGLRVTDPLSTHVMGNRTGSRGYLEIPGPKDKPRIDEWRDVPHGTVTQVWYPSKATGKRRSAHVYLPPGYHKQLDAQYPVVYLMHGSGDDDRHWSQLGQANVIADNLIADKKAVPMIIVMPDGHPAGTVNPAATPEERAKHSELNRGLFGADLLGDLIPLVDAEYRTRNDRESRAIVGLSMGAGQSLDVGLKNPERFAYVGAFSGGSARPDVMEKLTADPKSYNEQLRLLWIGIGKDDRGVAANRLLTEQLKQLGIKHEYHETEGAHSWMVWRGYLAEFLPRLFRGEVASRTGGET
jgi:enterochelin esterase-like enzyme